jgi:hypothetical protein
MPPTGETVAAMPANDVTLTGDEIAGSEAAHVIAYPLDDPDIFVPNDHRHRDRFLRPRVPVVNVDVSAADRGFPDPDEYVVASDLRHRHFLQPQARLGTPFHQRLHRFAHRDEAKRGEDEGNSV